jgi:hypothetical protein
LLDPNGKAVDPALVSATPDFVAFSHQMLPANFSSDPRLGGFGVVSAGLGVQYSFDNGLGFEAGLDYYRRASSLQFGGDGDTPYADYHYLSASLALVYDWQRAKPRHMHISDDSPSSLPMTWAVPASLWPAHSSSAPGTLMAGYRLMLDNPGMAMHMLDLHYAIDERWSVMLMPQFMTSRALHSTSPSHAQHQTTDRDDGAPTETLLASQWQWPASFSGGLWQLTAGLGVPMTGADSWSAQPALAYLRRLDRWQWGGELRGRFANESQSSQSSHQPWRLTELDLWSSRQLTSNVTATLHALSSNSHDILGSSHRQTLGIGFTVSLFNLPLQFEWLHQVSGSTPTAHATHNSIVLSLHLLAL